jgi:hypothetical protein
LKKIPQLNLKPKWTQEKLFSLPQREVKKTIFGREQKEESHNRGKHQQNDK